MNENVENFLKKAVNSSIKPQKLFECDTNFISDPEQTIIPSFFGGLILKNSKSSPKCFNFFTNAGKQVSNTIYFENYTKIHTTYIFPDSSICFLLNDGTFSIMRPSGYCESKHASHDGSDVVCSSSCYNGLTFITRKGTLIFIDAFTKCADTVYQLENGINVTHCALHDADKRNFLIVTDDNELYMKKRDSLSYIGLIPEKPSMISCPHKGSVCAAISKENVHMIVVDGSLSQAEIMTNIPIQDGATSFGWSSKTVFIIASSKCLTFISNFRNISSAKIGGNKLLVTDCGCARLISQEGCIVYVDEMEELNNLMKLKKDSQLLLSAYLLYKERSIECYKEIKLVNDISSAVYNFIEIANCCIDKTMQQTLMGAAAFGRCYSDISTGSDSFAENIQKLRIRNTVNDAQIGFALVPQMMEKFDTIILDRILNLQMYGEALSIAKSMNVSDEVVIERWAFDYLFRNGQNNLPKVMKKLEEYNDINYSKLADDCLKAGLKSNAIAIAQKINNPKDRVNFLQKVSQQDALYSAIASNDGASMLAFLYRARVLSNRGKVSCNATMNDTYSYVLAQHPGKVDGCSYDYMSAEQALMHGKYDFGASNEDCEEAIKRCDSTYPIFKKLIKDQCLFNTALDNKKPRRGPTQSPRQAIAQAALMGDENKFDDICKKFKFTEKTACVIKIQTFIQNSMWKEFDNMTRSEPQGLGWAGVANICIDLSQRDRAKKFVRLMRNSEEKLELCNRLEMWKEALDIAEDLNDENLISRYTRLAKV